MSLESASKGGKFHRGISNEKYGIKTVLDSRESRRMGTVMVGDAGHIAFVELNNATFADR